jgi:putative intracellular protease/amidase
MKVLFLLPASDYDPTESAVPYRALVDAGHDVWFATPRGAAAPADARLVEVGFGMLNPILMTRSPELATYRAMTASPRFAAPIAYDAVDPSGFDGLVIPGGHADGMRSLLESESARTICAHFFAADKPVGAICHGTLVLARTVDARTGASVLAGRTTTCLPATMELGAWLLTAPRLGRYYRTYPQTVQAEIRAAVGKAGKLRTGPLFSRRDSAARPERGFVVRDRNYVSARWPGDAHRFAGAFLQILEGR